MAGQTYRVQALVVCDHEVGTHEVGFNNRGPRVDQYQRIGTAYVGWVGFAWCAAFVMWGLKTVGFPVEKIPLRASVGYLLKHARDEGWVVDRPKRGDIFAWEIGSDEWPDHTGWVSKVLRLGPYFLFRTVEGNTSDGSGGSQDDGGGVYRRTRVMHRSKVTFIRIPGAPRRNSSAFLRRQKGKSAWVEWNTGTGRWKGWEGRAPGTRPNVVQRVPKGWWAALKNKKAALKKVSR